MPKENRQPIIHDTFARVNEDADPRKLQQGELPRLENAILDYPFGKVKARGGFVNQSGLSLSPTGCGKVINIKDSANNPVLLAGFSSAIYIGITSFASAIKSGLSGRANFSHAQMGEELVIANGAQAPFVLTGTNFATNYNLELPQPSVMEQRAQQAISAVGGLDVLSDYRWIWVYVTDTGERSLPSLPFTFGDGNTSQFTTNGCQVKFSTLEVPTDPRITSRWLYRTEGGHPVNTTVNGASLTGSVYYLVKKFDISLSYVIDGVPDDELDFSESIVFTRVPNKAEYVVNSNNRLFFGGVTLEQRYYNPPTYRGKNIGADIVVNGITYRDYPLAMMTPIVKAVGGTGNATGLTTNSYYRYAMTFVDKDGFETQPIYTDTILTAGANYIYAQLQFLISSSPASKGMGDAYLGSSSTIDINAVERRIYRTLASVATFGITDKPYYLVQSDKYNPLDTTGRKLPDFTDTISDSTIVGDLATYYPLVTTNPKTYPSGIAWSQPDRGAYIKLENVTQAFEEDDDPIVGMFDDGNGVLIFKTNSIVKLYHTGAPENWYQRKVWLEHGCDNPNALIKAGDIYYFQYRKRMYAMPTGGQPQYIGFGKQKTFDLHTITGMSANDEWVACTTTYGSNYYILIYDRKIQTWYQFNFGTRVVSVAWFQKYDATLLSGLLHAYIDRRLLKYDEAITTDTFASAGTTNIDAIVQLPRINLPDYSPFKIRNMIVDANRTGTATITLTSDATTHTPITVPSSANIPVRMIVGINGKPASTFFDVLLSGNFQFLNMIRTDIRPVRKGIGF